MTSFWNTAMACWPTIQWLDVDGISIAWSLPARTADWLPRSR